MYACHDPVVHWMDKDNKHPKKHQVAAHQRQQINVSRQQSSPMRRQPTKGITASQNHQWHSKATFLKHNL
jgi:hypothetical protein